jgi:hypothetical protein
MPGDVEFATNTGQGTGILLASADQPPPEDSGMVKVSIPRGPSPPAPGHHPHDRRRPPARLRLVPMAAETPGPRSATTITRHAWTQPRQTMIRAQTGTVVPGCGRALDVRMDISLNAR